MADPHQSYPEFVAGLQDRLPGEAALRNAVGGDFVAEGFLEEQLLRHLGLRDGAAVIDVGCGSGRLAFQLKRYPTLRYLGTDVVPELVRYADTLCQREDWEFRALHENRIPAPDACADFVCFFSVLTHLSHEDSFRYLAEAHRVLRPEGRIVLSFLEFRLAAHWPVFAAALDPATGRTHLNQFIERDALSAWALHLGLVVETVYDGDRPHIPLEADVVWPDGRRMSGLGNLGQSVAVLRRPSAP